MNRSDTDLGDLRQQVVGVLLAGGQSRRMFADGPGRGDKGLLEIGGKPMIAHVIARLSPQVGALVINVNGDRCCQVHYDIVSLH